MRLTSDYRHVMALFNTPAERVEYLADEESTGVGFKVGPFTYAMNFDPDSEKGKVIRVDFKLVDINVSDEELVEMMSKVRRQEIKEKGPRSPLEGQILKGEPISLEAAKYLEREILHSHSYSELEITGPYVLKIFGAVLDMVKSYVARRRPRCIVFSADSATRVSIYSRLMRRAFPKAHIKESSSPWGAGTEIKVCFI